METPTLSAPTLTVPRRRRVVTAGETESRIPGARFEVPVDRDFYHDDFIEAPELQQLGNQLIRKWPELSGLSPVRIRYLWRKKGATSAGKDVLGKCTKISGISAYFGDCDFTVVIAADFVRQHQLTNHQMEALVYHELLHIEVGEDEKTGDQILSPRGHDAELFYDEIRRYGLWKDSLQGARDIIQQLALPLAGEGQ